MWWRIAGFSLYLRGRQHGECQDAEPEIQVGIRKKGLKDIRREEILQHKTAETGVWVTFNEGVYDMSEFLEGHPGKNIC